MANTTLLHFNGADASTTIVDDVGTYTWTAVGNAQLDTSQQKFGTASAQFDGTGDYVESTDIVALPASGGWTIDFWVRFNSLASNQTLFNYYKSVDGAGIKLLWNSAGPQRLNLLLSSNGVTYDISAGATGTKADTYSVDTWYHIALVRDDGTGAYYVYVDGTLDITVSSASQITSTLNRLRIGSHLFGTGELNGRVDEFRIANTNLFPGGTSFTPATTAYSESGAAFTLPKLVLSAGGIEFGARFSLPVYTLVVAGGSDLLGAAFTLPLLTLSAGGIAGGAGTAEFVLPMLVAVTSGIQQGFGVAEFTLPALTLGIAGIQQGFGAAEFFLPVWGLLAAGATGHVGGSAFDLPVLTLGSYGLQDSTGASAFDLPVLFLNAQGQTALAEAYRTWVLNTRKGALTEYTNFAFNSYTLFQGQVLAAGPGGIVSLGVQALDNTSVITARARTGAADYDSSMLKRVPRIYLGYKAGGDMLFRTIVIGTGERTYALPWNKLSGLQQRRIPIGKGPKSRYFQFEVENQFGADFSIHNLLVYPTILRRRVM